MLPIKNRIILIFTILHFFFLKKIKKNVWRYYYFTPVCQKSWWYNLQFLKDRASQTEIGNFSSSVALLLLKKIQNTKFWNNEKHSWAYDRFTHVYQKSQSYDVWFLRYGVRQTKFFVILGHLLPFYPPNDAENLNLKKNEKNV